MKGSFDHLNGYDRNLPERRLAKVSAPHNARESRRFFILLGIFIPSLAISLYTGKSIFIFGYIMVCAFAFNGPLHHNRPWSELGIKRGFVNDLKKVWYYVGTEALLFQILAPTFIIAAIFGFYPQLVEHIAGRVPVDISSIAGLSSLGVLLIAVAVLTLIEDIVFRVTIQERMSWLIGTPLAILLATMIFSLCHAVGTTGSLEIISMDLLGVFIDGALLGMIYARTHNLALTWMTHYIGDVIGLIVIALVL